jgi:hypothetical protein
VILITNERIFHLEREEEEAEEEEAGKWMGTHSFVLIEPNPMIGLSVELTRSVHPSIDRSVE